MNMRKINIAVAAVLALSTATAFAEPGNGNGLGRGGPSTGAANHPGNFRGAEASTRALLAALHVRLGITASQETAWQAFANAVVAEVIDAESASNALAAAHNAVDALNASAAALRKQADDAAAVAQAFAALYNLLTASQRAIVDDVFAHGNPF